MKIRNNDPLDLEGDNGETITVRVVATGTQFLVNYVLDGVGSPLAVGLPLIFTLDKSKHDPSILTFLVTFSNLANGGYRFEVTGSHNVDTSIYAVTQSFGIPGNSFTYTFDVV
jgi:hypothetical protein